MKDVILNIFAEVVDLLAAEKYIKLEHYFLDGTKIEANANKYSWVWSKSTSRYKEQLREKCKKLFDDIDELQREENERYGDNDLSELGTDKPIDSEAIQRAAERINERLKKKPDDKQLKKAQRSIENDYLPRMEKYEEQERILKKRRSYSKTDQDATFMRMKEDHMKNGQLKPGYNIQIGTENQFVIGYSAHQRPGDTSCMIDHLNVAENILGKLPSTIIADAGYGSEQNYEAMEKLNLTAYVKYNTFHKEMSKAWKEDQTRPQNWTYHAQTDTYYCSKNRPLIYIGDKKSKTENGYETTSRVYECLNCEGCPIQDQCVKTKEPQQYDNRRIYVNRKKETFCKKTRDLLLSEDGIKLRSRRAIEPESVFGNIKGNFGVRRFMLKGLDKIKIEWGLICIAHNMRKMTALMA